MPSTFYLIGPTAVGKSDLAVAVAEQLDAEIVGCDAFQVYRELPILTAQPSQELRDRIAHHLIGHESVTTSYDAAQYSAQAESTIATLHRTGRNALVVGGSGMYLRALTHGLADLPQADLRVRAELGQLSVPDLCALLQKLDPDYFQQVDQQNSRRLVRAVEVCLLTGRTYSELRREWDQPKTELNGVLLVRDRDELQTRIDLRTREMFSQGLLAEIDAAPPPGQTASKTLGLAALKQALQGQLSLEVATDLLRTGTRQYAKRQMTWFRRETWLKPVDLSRISSSRDAVTEVLRQLERQANASPMRRQTSDKFEALPKG